jgi:4-hydroxy-tetrahydrodipicolinate reductase
MSSIKILAVGLGPIGQKVVQYLWERNRFAIVAAVDPAPGIAGRDLGEVCGLPGKLDVVVHAELRTAMDSCQPDLAVLCTGSSLEAVAPQVEDLTACGLPVVSTCEELSYPWRTNLPLARRIDEAAKRHGVAVLGTGVNPGFLMDFLPLTLTAICRKVQQIKVSRIQDASIRRGPFQAKIGAGLTLAQFEAKRKAGALRHVGLTESIHMIAARFDWQLERTEDILTPVVADCEITGGHRPIQAGMAAGVQQIGRGYVGGEPRITLEFIAAVGQPDPRDAVEVVGDPSFTSVIPGGIHGDVATCALVVNAIRSVLAASPGLRTMADLPPVSFFDRLAAANGEGSP